MMKFLLVLILIHISPSLAEDESCVEQPTDPCANISEYSAYITCLDENKRHKRSVGCPFAQAESCEYVDCQSCQESCPQDCTDCECPSTCKQCCSEICSTNLCCHKTCHNQCKTNYCRTECKKDCKDRISQMDTNIEVNVKGNNSINSQSRHNITTIINLHNIINNTNLIDIPISINNTNFNNITLRRAQQSSMSYNGGREGVVQPPPDPETGEKCCFVVSPRQCVKTNYFPFMKCFHYRHKKCGPFCVATIIHAQNQNYCDDSGCHTKLFYIPQIQPKCYYTPGSPNPNCGGHQTYHNCQGCYDHITGGTQTTGIHHHMRCSRCYDNSGGNQLPAAPAYQPPMMPGYSGNPGMYGGYPGIYGSYPGMYGGYPMMPPMPPMVPMYQSYPGYGPPGQMYAQQMSGQVPQYYGQNPPYYAGPIDNEVINNENPSSENYNEMKYPLGTVGHYIHETVIPADKLLKSGSTGNDPPENTNLTDDSNGSRYALISIDAKQKNHEKREEKKEKKIRRKKHDPEHSKKEDHEKKSSA